jgi:hypothetical protein
MIDMLIANFGILRFYDLALQNLRYVIIYPNLISQSHITITSLQTRTYV